MFGIMAYKGGDRMIRVAICDDDKHMQESLSKYLLDYSIQCDREIDHAEFDTCEELMDHYCSALTLKITNIRYYDTVFDFMCSIFKHLFSLSLIQIISFKKFNYSFIGNWLFYIIIGPYLVNKNYIERFTSHSVVLIGIDRVELPISPNKKMEVSEQLLKE